MPTPFFSRRHALVRHASACALLASFWLGPRQASAVQPLRTFVEAGLHANYDVRQSVELSAQRQAEATAASNKLVPSIALGGTYTRNQYQALLPINGRILRLAPHDQLNAQATLTVPVLDVISWARRSATRAQARAASAQGAGGQIESARQVAKAYYGLLGSEGVFASAEGSQRYAERALRLARDRFEVGAASALDVARAESDAAEAEQQVAAADVQVLLARRSLQTLTGLTAEPAGPMPEANLADEAPLAHWMGSVDGRLPRMAEATALQQAALAADRAAAFGYLPTVNVTASEAITNASALNGGHTWVWTAKANFNWQLDATLTPTKRAQAHAARSALVRGEQVQRSVADTLYADWAQVRANQAQSRAARAQVRATKLAESLALDKAQAGMVTQLEVTQARRDAFNAEVSRIQADANLLYYRTLLRLDCASSVAAFEEPAP